MAKTVQCPNWACRSKECIPLTEKKKYSVGKGAVGVAAMSLVAAPLGVAGALAGLNGKKKVKMMCTKCGRVFEIKV